MRKIPLIPVPASTPKNPSVRPRLAFVDAARGAALIAMIFYHLTWDLAFFGFVDPDLPLSPPLRIYARGVAIVFLLLVGASLVLARGGGDYRRRVVRRFLMLALASAGISLATWLLFPENFIFFGTLHCIAAASLLALPCLAAPAWLAAFAGCAFLLLPAVVALPAFDQPPLWWVGLGTMNPSTLDYRPLFPWAGFVFLGLFAARLVSPRHRPEQTARRGLLQWAGRHSLLVYLAHQPPILAILFVAAQFAGPRAAASDAAFQQSCRQHCAAAADASPVCAKACLCVARELNAEQLWAKANADLLSDEERDRFGAIARDCRAAARLP